LVDNYENGTSWSINRTEIGKNGAGDHLKPEFIDHPMPGLNT
jgi:hypothetical protein